MSLTNMNEYYKKKALKYYTKYIQLKLKLNNSILKGGYKPVWFDELITETKLIYDSLSKETDKNIILSGSAAIALLLGNLNMFEEITMAFQNSMGNRPHDLDFIYQGGKGKTNLDIKSIIINYFRKKIFYTMNAPKKRILFKKMIRKIYDL